VKNPKIESLIVNNKVLGPILPIIEYDQIDEVQSILNKKDNVETMFYFSKNTRTKELVSNQYKFKNLYFNDTNIPISNPYMRKSGIFSIGDNSLYGVYGIKTFSKHTLFYRGLMLNNEDGGAMQKLAGSFYAMQRINRKMWIGSGVAG